MAFTASDICKIIFAVILPPLGVFLERGCGADFLINILLTLLGYLPGIIHALYVYILRTRRPSRYCLAVPNRSKYLPHKKAARPLPPFQA
ncbi:hypothetical protein F4824DRAFT_495063 [Ustulina deusta]|nr:hypothetical protein F4824DRAFT_495063 [Ustulina deusta]